METMNSSGKGLSRKNWIAVGLVTVMVFVLGFTLSACKQDTAIPKEQGTAANTTDQTQFGTGQNDSEGYDGRAWGVKSNATGNLDGEDRELLGLVFNLPIKTTSVAGADMGEHLDMGLLPELSVEPVNETSYVFYRGELAMALVKLDAHNYDSVKATIESKGYLHISEDSKNYRPLGDASDGDSTGLEAVLYKRGNTNTRVYLMKHILRSPYGASFTAYLLYMPNHYYSLISTETQNTQNQRNLDTTHAAEQRAEPDKQNVQ